MVGIAVSPCLIRYLCIHPLGATVDCEGLTTRSFAERTYYEGCFFQAAAFTACSNALAASSPRVTVMTLAPLVISCAWDQTNTSALGSIRDVPVRDLRGIRLRQRREQAMLVDLQRFPALPGVTFLWL